jgi:hypothetical protein
VPSVAGLHAGLDLHLRSPWIGVWVPAEASLALLLLR